MIVQRCQIAATRRRNDIRISTDNAIFEDSAQKIDCNVGCVALSAVLLKPNVANILLFNFREQKVVQHGAIALTIDSKSRSSLIFEKNGPMMPLDQNPHQTVTRCGCIGFSSTACGFSVPQIRQFCLFTYPLRWK